MTTRWRRYVARCSGFSLIELMIGMALGLFLLLGITDVYLAQRQAYRTNEGLSQVQVSARIAFELMAKEIRDSGVNPCGARVVANVLNGSSASLWLNWGAGGLRGYESSAALPSEVVTTAAARVSGTDAIVVRSAALSNGAIVAGHGASSNAIVLNTTSHGFATGNLLMVCDYSQAAVFQTSGASAASASIAHAKDSGTPGNCVNDFPLDCSGSGSAHTFAVNGFVTPVIVSVWYVGTNDRGGRSLFRILNNGTPQEIAEGVTNMQLQYLTRTGTTPASNYVDATSISNWSDAAANGSPVIAVRLILDLESKEAVGTDAATLERKLIHVISRRGYREL